MNNYSKIYYQKNKQKFIDNATKWRAKNKNRYKEIYHYSHLKRTYGLLLVDYLKLIKIQNNRCAICNTKNKYPFKRLSVDHCHKTNKIRGLLCANCNTGLGYFKDKWSILNQAVKYLKQRR